RRQSKNTKASRRAKEPRERMTESLKPARTLKDNARRNELQRNDPNVFAAEGNHSRVARENTNQRGRCEIRNQRELEHHQRRNPDRRINRVPDSIRAASAEVLSYNRRNSKAERDYR